MATKREQIENLVHGMEAMEKSFAEKDPSAEEHATYVKMSEDLVALMEAFASEAKASGQLNVAKQFLGELGTSSAVTGDTPPEVIDGIVNPKGMTFGEALVKSPAYESLLKTHMGPEGALRKGSRINDTTLLEVPGFNAKALVTGASDTSAGAFVTPARYGPVTDLIGERRLTVRDLCTNINIQSDTFEFVQVTAKTNNAAGVAEATTSATPGLNNVAVGAYSASHGVKPESAMTFAVVSTPVETIAHIMPISRRAAADAPQVRQMVDAFLLYGLREEEEDQILNGDGTSPNLDGILQTAGISTVGSAGTDLDAVVDAIRTIQNDNRYPTAMVVHPNDWYSTGFLLAKDSAGNYLVANPTASVDQLNALWGLRVVVTPAMTENTVLVGDFRQAVVADRQQSTIYVSDSHNDWFARNLLAILAEERLALGVLDPDAFCTVTAV